jgi:hypothetical protein
MTVFGFGTYIFNDQKVYSIDDPSLASPFKAVVTMTFTGEVTLTFYKKTGLLFYTKTKSYPFENSYTPRKDLSNRNFKIKNKRFILFTNGDSYKMW